MRDKLASPLADGSEVRSGLPWYEEIGKGGFAFQYGKSQAMSPAYRFTLHRTYTRYDIRSRMGDQGQGGAWDTGYREYRGEYFIFAGVGVPGRTGHHYNNFWDGEQLVWEAKTSTKLDNPVIRRLIGGRFPVHIFTRADEREAFRYEGLGRAVSATATTPVGVCWALDSSYRPPLTKDQVADELRRLNFSLDPPMVQTQRACCGELVVYIKQKSESFVLVVHPAVADRLEVLQAIPGVRRPMPAEWFVHNTSFLGFPSRRHTGSTERPYGLDFDFDTPEALEAFMGVLQESGPPPPRRSSALRPITGDPRTETESVRAARLGQTRFRNELMARWSRRCALTGFPLPELLRASHIQPWRDSSHAERVDPENGLLLALHVDGLFDRGLISFADDGALLRSPVLEPTVLELLGLSGTLRINGLSEENRRYLHIHRSTYFQ